MHNGESLSHQEMGGAPRVTSNKKPAPHLKEDFFNEHLPYEITMLRATYDLARANRPATEHNALVSSFLMHARNLIEFYKDRPGCDFDPRMFTTASFQLNRDFIADQLAARVTAHVSHLTTRRISQAADELGPREWALILRALEEETARFVKALTKDYASKWLLHQPRTPARVVPSQESAQSFVLRRANLTAPVAVAASES
jgi:hypothetical protein